VRIAQQFLTALLLCASPLPAERILLTDLSRLELRNTQAEVTIYRERRALKLTERPAGSENYWLSFAAIHSMTERTTLM
jgi:hypothetical protein